MICDQISYDMQTLQKLQQVTTGLDMGAATLSISALWSDIPTSFNIRNTVIGFPLHYPHKQSDRLSSY